MTPAETTAQIAANKTVLRAMWNHAATTDRPVLRSAAHDAQAYWEDIAEDRAAEARGDHMGPRERDELSDRACDAWERDYDRRCEG